MKNETPEIDKPRVVPPYPPAMHDEAFDLYCAGLSRARIAATLRERHGQLKAPGESTLYRWLVRDQWILRRSYIRNQAHILGDRRRSREPSSRLRQLVRIQDRFLSSAEDLPCRSGGEAVRALAHLQRIMIQLAGECPEETTRYSPDTLAYVMDTVFKFLKEDEELLPVLERRWYHICRRIEQSIADDASSYE